MTSKFKNRMKRVLYRPAKKRPYFDFLVKRLSDAENALDATVGGVFGKRGKRKRKSGGDKKDDKKDDKKGEG